MPTAHPISRQLELFCRVKMQLCASRRSMARVVPWLAAQVDPPRQDGPQRRLKKIFF